MIRMMRVCSILVFVAALLALCAAPAGAATATVTTDVPGAFQFMHGERPTSDGSHACVDAIFAQWTHVPNAVSVKVKHRWRSGGDAANGGPFTDRELTLNRDNPKRDYRFDNKWPGDQIFQAEPGVDWAQLPYNWVVAGIARCAETRANLHRTVEGTPHVQLTLEVTSPSAASLKGTQRLPIKTRRATIGTVTCPKYGVCTVQVPKTIKVKIGGKSGKIYTLVVTASKKLTAGAKATTGKVTVTFPLAAAAALKGTTVRPSVKVTMHNHGKLKTTKTLQRGVRY